MASWTVQYKRQEFVPLTPVTVVCLLQLFRCFNHLGICHSIAVTRRNVDMIAAESRATLQQWREDVVETVKRTEVCIG